MDGDAFLFMILSWSLILGLNLFCFTLLFTRAEPPRPEGVRPKGEDFEEPEEIT